VLPIVTGSRATALIATVPIGVQGSEPVAELAGERPARDGFALATIGNVL
jgi:hypothetical protein